MRGALDANFPADLRKAIDASPRARKPFQSLGRQNLYALAFRTTHMKTPADVRGKSPHWSICWNAVKRLTPSVADSLVSRRWRPVFAGTGLRIMKCLWPMPCRARNSPSQRPPGGVPKEGLVITGWNRFADC